MGIVAQLIMLMFTFHASDGKADQNEYRLMRYLMNNYDKSVRPAKNASEPMNVTFGLALTQIIDVDERNQILTTNSWLNQMWIDYNLQWNESEFGGIQVIRVPAEKVWKPDIILYNNADSQYNLALLSTNVIVSSDGNLTWLSSAILKSSCQINVEYFPFDEQKCTFKFASWTYDGYQVNLVIQTEEGDLSNYVTNGEWDLIDMVVKRNVVFYSCCEEPYPDVTYTIILRRRPLFYAFNLILPCVLITGIALMSFYMPSDSGEKVTLGITTLLSMTVFLMVIGESMPPTSEKLPLIGIYYGVTISLVTFATGLAVVTLNIHHRGMRGREVPRIVKRFVFGFLAKILLIKFEPSEYPVLSKGKQMSVPPPPPPPSAAAPTAANCTNDIPLSVNGWTNYSYCHRHESTCTIHHSPIPNMTWLTSEYNQNGNSDVSSDTDKGDQNGGISTRYGNNHHHHHHRLLQPHTALHSPLDPYDKHLLRILNRLYQTLDKYDIRIAEQDRKEAIKLEWQQIALVCDRFLLWVFIIATVGATFGILYMSPHTQLF
ncbi:Cholinergic receptor, nicotinic, alpha [Chamberlinius hualienensis]